MFGNSTKRGNAHYRETMRRLQPQASEATALRVAGYYRGLNLLMPLAFLGQPQRARPPRDY